MNSNERITKLNLICLRHGRPNNQYFKDGLAVVDENGQRRQWVFRFVDADIVTEISINADADIYRRYKYRVEPRPAGYTDEYRLDEERSYGPFSQYNDRVDAKIDELFDKYNSTVSAEAKIKDKLYLEAQQLGSIK